VEARYSETDFSDVQLDALSELANIGSGAAATALSQMLGRSVAISVPNALALPLADAVDALGPPENVLTSVVLPVFGELSALVLMLFDSGASATLCKLLGSETGTEIGDSALCEVANILGSSYIGSLATMTGLELEPHPPQLITDMLGAIVSSVLATAAEASDIALLLESNMAVEGEACSFSFMLVPSTGGVSELLGRLGL
jgi:chemotaxis protein CheC